MTAPVDRDREELAAALRGLSVTIVGYNEVSFSAAEGPMSMGSIRALLDALAPVVARREARAAARAWNSAADELELSGMPEKHWAVAGFRARAATLDTEGETDGTR